MSAGVGADSNWVGDRLQRPASLAWLFEIGTLAAHKPMAAFGGAVILVFVVVALAAPLIAPYGYDEGSVSSRLQEPSAKHLFGTDNTGRDQLSRVIYGARTSLGIGLGAMVVGVGLATLLGVAGGYFGGRFDTLLQRVLEVCQAFPGLIAVIFVVTIVGSSLLSITLTIGVLFSFGMSRIVRSAVLGLKWQPYVESATVVGASHLRIVLRHVLPNILPVVIVASSIQIGSVILVESSLAFLGLGIPEPFPSWGRMLQAAQRYMQTYPHLAIFPGLAITLVVFSFNMLGDGLRDVLDPRLRHR